MKYGVIEAQRAEFPVSRLCAVLGVSRQGYYAWSKHEPSPRQREDAVLVKQIKTIHQLSNRTYGSPRLQRELQAQGQRCSQRRLQRLMRQEGLVTRYPHRRKPRTSWANPAHPKFPNLLARQFEATRPNEKWLCDITYIDTLEGWIYAAAILDLYSRRIVGLAVDHHMETELVERALHMALTERCPSPGLLHHSDQGSQYTSWQYTDLLGWQQFDISMSRKGQCWDNAPMESFWGTLKAECADAPFLDLKHARSQIFAYTMGWYNRQRRHSSLDYLSPDQFEQQKFWTQ